ncbi:hypothetical protein ACLK1S_01445 [Escherichia coli]
MYTVQPFEDYAFAATTGVDGWPCQPASFDRRLEGIYRAQCDRSTGDVTSGFAMEAAAGR